MVQFRQATHKFSNNEIQNERKYFGNFNKGRGNIAWVGFFANEQSLENWHVMFFIDGIKLFMQKSCIIF